MCGGGAVARLPIPPPSRFAQLHRYGCIPFHRPFVSSLLFSMPFILHYVLVSSSYLPPTLSVTQTYTAMSIILRLFLLSFYVAQLETDGANAQGPQNPNQCKAKCGGVLIPFPFYVNQSHCGWSLSKAFGLSCVNSSSLFLSIGSASYRVLDFFSDGILVDFPNTTICRQYNDLKSFPFSESEYLSISSDNVLDLYDCEDSSLCKADCEKGFVMSACDGKEGDYPSCCYPLSDHSVWPQGGNKKNNVSFSVFSQFGCRGFSSWIALPGSKTASRGVKLEWAVPRNSSTATCAANAYAINASSVTSGMRCQCQDGFVGDGFAAGSGCLKSCFKDGKEVYGDVCYPINHRRKKAALLAGILTSGLALASLTALFCLLKRPIKSDVFISDQTHCPSTTNILARKPFMTRLFTYRELEEATKGFEDRQKIVDTLYAGVLVDGLCIAVQRLVECESQRDLIQVLSRLEALSAVSHKNMARLVGWYIETGYTPLVVYEYPENGTLEEHLLHQDQDHKIALHWYRRLNIAAETACGVAFLHEISPPVFHHNLQSGCIFLDEDFSVKLAAFELLHDDGCHSSKFEVCRRNDDVYRFGLILLELITGTTSSKFSTLAMQKIKNGKLEEIVDPSLYYHEQPPFWREQIEIVADLATRCLLFGADGKLSMVDVARELVHLITKDNLDGNGSRRSPALEETFSNSSLLQMISTSPDSVYLP